MSAVTARDIAAVYDARAAIPFDGFSNRPEIEATIAWLIEFAPNRSSPICDVGCNEGWHLKELSYREYDYLFGIDLSVCALRTCSSRVGQDASLILGDVATWGVQEYFEVVTNFNSCLGVFSRGHDREFLQGVHRILRRNGLFFLTYLSLEKADGRAGNFDVRYDLRSTSRVQSSVRFDSARGHLSIEQRIDDTFVPLEDFQVYSEADMQQLLSQEGFRVVFELRNTSPSGNAPQALSFVSGVLAQKASA